MPHRTKISLHLIPILKSLKRGPQIVLPKDFGAMLAYSGIDKTSRVVEAGAGSGYLTVQLARFCRRVVSYEKDERFYRLARQNISKSGVRNVRLKFADALKGISERKVDLVVLDMPESHLVIPHAYKALKKNGCLIGYNPNMEQVKRFVLTARGNGFKDDFTIEVIARDILVREYGVRPVNVGLTHTGYITFAWKR